VLPIVSWLAVAVAVSAVPGPAPDGDLRVMSLNVRYGTAPDGDNAWERRRDLVARAIEGSSPDLLATQECLAGQARWLESRFPRFGFVGAGRDDGREAGEMVAIFFDRERFSKAAEGHFWLSEKPDTAGSRGWDAALPRIATWVRLRPSGRSAGDFCFVSTHLDHEGAVARIESARLLERKLDVLCAGVPVILAGDFNAPASDDRNGPYRELTFPRAGRPRVLTDTFRAAGGTRNSATGEGTFHAFTGRGGSDRIDWILVSPEFSTVSAGIDRDCPEGRCPSDHFPVTAVIRRRGPPPAAVRSPRS
jgi:endonuclease/exonuclease/phosphatase family metal-dependent hydrolase